MSENVKPPAYPKKKRPMSAAALKAMKARRPDKKTLRVLQKLRDKGEAIV
jgi:hypothetical protein